MLELIKRCPEYTAGYREYCREMYAQNVVFFRPPHPDTIDDGWFERTKDWYDKKENGLIPGKPVSFHYWAVDGGRFIGEFQLRTEFTEQVLTGIGNVGYAVRPSEWRKGCGSEILRQGLLIARSHGMERVMLNINEENTASIRLCEKLGGTLLDRMEAYNPDEGQHVMRRYIIVV